MHLFVAVFRAYAAREKRSERGDNMTHLVFTMIPFLVSSKAVAIPQFNAALLTFAGVVETALVVENYLFALA